MSDKSRVINGTEVFERENKHGVKKDHIEVNIGTVVVEVPRYLKNPITERREDLTKLSDDGYLKTFLALYHHHNSRDLIDLDSSPVLTFDLDKWTLEEKEGQAILKKQKPESRLGKQLFDE